MTVAAVLLAYAAFVGMLGARVLARARWTARAPLLGILTYLPAGGRCWPRWGWPGILSRPWGLWWWSTHSGLPTASLAGAQP